MLKKVCRGDLFIADLNPVKGSEQGGVRPVLVIQNNRGNRYASTVIVAAMSRRVKEKAKLPTHCLVQAYSGVKDESMVLLEQIRTIDKQRLQKYIGRLNRRDMEKVNRCLAISLALKIS